MHSSVAAAFSQEGFGEGQALDEHRNVQDFGNCVGVTPQCYICEYAITNSSKDILCVICFQWTFAPIWGC